VAACPSCGKEVPGDFPFCPFCAAPLAKQPAGPAQEERKVVSVLFCDIVGFTAASEQADPEDVRARIRPYYASLRQELAGFGGTVEKFIGDAVMAVFGAPVSHEDDAERAVRAGLRILEAIEELNVADPALSLQVRIGISTGEAVVDLGARPDHGEGIVTGDVVNTASRLQGAAPVDGIAVSEHTYRATERVFDYEQLPPVEVKGKAEPLALFRPRAARARFGSGLIRTQATPLVGRELEKPLLIGTFERSAQQRSCQLVTIVGEPGVGKSRLCAELFQYIDERRELVTWRQGRCLPYGDGIAFWALREIVKAECGLLESDSSEQATAKLERALPADDPDLPWLQARLQPLIGAGGEPVAQEESFTAWCRFLEALAAKDPTVLVFEDLHWADPALLSFLEHLADRSLGVPLLLVCTARPELYERHPAWAAGLGNATTINLATLTEEETGRLISALLERAALPAETQRALIERAGGNPLYAEEFARLLADRGRLEMEVPDSLQALIAARLDTLPAERKRLLQNAAVLGKVFWAGALAEMGDRDLREVEHELDELSRRELVRPARTSSMEGEAEYGFWHLLVRDVCYAQISRATRATRHRAAAAWIERKAGERAEDLADVLAHHYLSALELARAAGQSDQADELESGTIRYLTLAGARALALDVDRAEQSLARALDLAPADHPDRAPLLELWAQAVQQQGRQQEAKEALEEALVIYRAGSDPVATGRSLTALALVLGRLGDPRREDALAEALELLEAQSRGQELVSAYAQLAGRRDLDHAFPEAIAAADRALALASELGIAEPARALGFRGSARAASGEREGLEEMRRALHLSVEQGRSRDAAVLYNNISVDTWQYEGPQAALAVCREGIDFCRRRGITEFAFAIAGASLSFLAESGKVEQALAEAAPVAEQAKATGMLPDLIEARSVVVRWTAERGQPEDPEAAESLAAIAREAGTLPLIAAGFAAAAQALLTQGRLLEARDLLIELDEVRAGRSDPLYATLLPHLLRLALVLLESELAFRLVDGVEPHTPLAEHALMACRSQLAEAAAHHTEAAELYAEAAERWQQFGAVPERAYALLGEGRCLATLGEPAADAPLREARELFISLGYKPALAETEALLAQGEAAAL
jgi:class 3 adenylate cyclase/tetratricopeptide (TPR) repeat protein